VREKTLAVVIATIREDSINRWLEAWQPFLADVPVYVIEDGTPSGAKMRLNIQNYSKISRWSWHGIEKKLGDKSWIIPRYSSAIKSFGFLRAYLDGHDYIWTLDDDCFPEPNSPLGHQYPYTDVIKHFLETDQASNAWYNTIEHEGLYPRGYPYGIRQDKQPVMIWHGLWSGVPDLDGVTALEHHKLRLNPATGIDRIPTGQMFPMCGMNLAFKREIAPAMYFGLQGKAFNSGNGEGSVHQCSKPSPLPFDRFDDIWAGLFAKRICDHLGYAVVSGAPSIVHTKESDPTQRVLKEAPGIAAHEIMWPKIANSHYLHGGHTTVKSCYKAIADRVDCASYDMALPFPDYWKKLAQAMHLWTELF
jgi:hypothetical protein